MGSNPKTCAIADRMCPFSNSFVSRKEKMNSESANCSTLNPAVSKYGELYLQIGTEWSGGLRAHASHGDRCRLSSELNSS